MAMKTEPFGQNIADAINQLSLDAVKITGITNSTIVNDSAYGFARSLMAFGKTEQLGIPTPTEPKELKSWNGLITSRKLPDQETIDLGFELYGIRVDDGGNYTDSDGQMWLCDKIDMKKGVIVRNLAKEKMESSYPWTESNSFAGDYVLRNWATDRGIRNSHKHLQTHFRTQSVPASFSIGDAYMGSDINFWIGTATCPDVASWKAWLDANDLSIIYAMASSVEEPLTSEQKNKLLQIRTYDSGTIFDFGVETPFFEIGYWLNNQNGQALADMDAKINQLLIN